MTTDDTKKRISKVHRGIERTLTTAKYESVVIYSYIEEEIEWSSIEEREKKSRNWDTFLIEDFKKTHEAVLSELGLSHKSAYFKNNVVDKDYRSDSGVEHELDNLDTLE